MGCYPQKNLQQRLHGCRKMKAVIDGLYRGKKLAITGKLLRSLYWMRCHNHKPGLAATSAPCAPIS
jgi:hypothetical protein